MRAAAYVFAAMTAAAGVSALVACAESASTSSGPANGTTTSSSASAAMTFDVPDAAAEIAAIEATLDAAANGNGGATAAVDTTGAGATPKADIGASSPNGKCRSASAPAPEYRSAAMAAAQSTLICYEYALRRHAPSPAHLEVVLDVNENGSLRNAVVENDDFADEKMKSCAMRKLQDAKLPSPATGCGMISRLPLTYMRADGGS